jgi:hypothetical protein
VSAGCHDGFYFGGKMALRQVVILEKTIPENGDIQTIWRDVNSARTILERTEGQVYGTITTRDDEKERAEYYGKT